MSNPDTKIKSFRLAKGKTSLKQIGLILLVALFFIGLVWLGGWGVNRGIDRNEPASVNMGGKNENIVIPQITQAPEGELPEGFPGIPLNDKKEITSSYMLDYGKAGQEQKVIDFISSKSVKENFAFYKDWAEKDGWNIFHQLDSLEESRLIVEKNKKPLNITIQKDTATSSKVNMSW